MRDANNLLPALSLMGAWYGDGIFISCLQIVSGTECEENNLDRSLLKVPKNMKDKILTIHCLPKK